MTIEEAIKCIKFYRYEIVNEKYTQAFDLAIECMGKIDNVENRFYDDILKDETIEYLKFIQEECDEKYPKAECHNCFFYHKESCTLADTSIKKLAKEYKEWKEMKENEKK